MCLQSPKRRRRRPPRRQRLPEAAEEASAVGQEAPSIAIRLGRTWNAAEEEGFTTICDAEGSAMGC